MKKLCLAFTLFAAAFAAAAPAGYYRRVENSPQLISQSLPPDAAPYRPPRFVDLAGGAVIVGNRPGRFDAAPGVLQRKLEQLWGVTLPILPEREALESGKALFLVGNAYANDLLCRLAILGYLTDPAAGYELRAISHPMEWRTGAVYLGGRTGADIAAAIDAFLARYPARPETIGKLIDCPRAEPAATADGHLAAMREGYRGRYSNFTAVRALSRVAADYNATGDDAYAEAFAAMMALFREHYEKVLDFRRTPPHFIFHLFPTAVDLIEESPAFTDAHQLLAAEIARFVSEEVMKNGDMSLPQRLYNGKQRAYMTNHPAMAIRSMYFNGDFLLRRYRFEPARYWLAVAEYGMDCEKDYLFSPEDALAYQYHVPEIFIYYAIGSGRCGVNDFDNDVMRSYLRYTYAMIDQRGGTIGLGDTYPVQRTISYSGLQRMLESSVRLLDRRESLFFLQRLNAFTRRYSPSESAGDASLLAGEIPPPGPDSLGLQVFTVRPDKFETMKTVNTFARPVLDKAVFRTGWDPQRDQYLCLTGINGGPHGHYDANGIAAYVVGDFDYLADRDYVQKFPDSHNSVSVLFQGRSPTWSRQTDERKSFSQLLGSVQRPDRRGAAISLLLEDYNRCDWRRHLAIETDHGLYVVDEIIARESGEFLAEARFRVLGRPQPGDDGVVFRRVEPGTLRVLSRLAIAEGTGSRTAVTSQFDSGSNARESGYFGAYAESGGENTAVLTERHRRYLRAGERLFFVNRLNSGAPEAIEELAPGLWRIGAGDRAALVGAGELSLGKFHLQAGFFKLDRHGLLAIGADAATDFAGRELPIGNVAFDLATLQIDAAGLGAAIAVPPGRRIAAAAPELVTEPLEPVELARQITALAMHESLLGVGTEDGRFEVRTLDGAVHFERQFPTEITAVAPVPSGDAVHWAIGLHPGGEVTPQGPQDAQATGTVVLLDSAGRELWRAPMPYGNSHRAIVRTLFTARLKKGAPPAVVAGVTAWMYVVLDGESGALERRLPVLHPATAGAAGDLDGDGVDEIGVGCEYYYLRIYDAAGQALYTTSQFQPYGLTFDAADLDGDGRAEFYTGRGDGTLARLTMDRRKRVRTAAWNLGGPPAGSAVSGRALYTVSVFGAVRRLDAQGFHDLGLLDSPIRAFAGSENHLIAAGADGRCYRLDREGAPQAVFTVTVNPASVRPILCAAAAPGAVVASGSKLYIVR